MKLAATVFVDACQLAWRSLAVLRAAAHPVALYRVRQVLWVGGQHGRNDHHPVSTPVANEADVPMRCPDAFALDVNARSLRVDPVAFAVVALQGGALFRCAWTAFSHYRSSLTAAELAVTFGAGRFVCRFRHHGQANT